MGEPKPNEVWETFQGNLALIVCGPDQYFDIDGVKPPGAAYFPAIYARHKTKQGWGVLFLFCDPCVGYVVAELRDRLMRKTDLTPADFFSRTAEILAKAVEHQKWRKDGGFSKE
jgi:hypothetical protein